MMCFTAAIAEFTCFMPSWRIGEGFRYAIFRDARWLHIHNSKIIQVPTGLHLPARDGVNDGRCTEKVAIILQVSIYPYSIHIPSISMLCTWNEDSVKRSGHRKWMKMGYERRCHYRSIWRCCFFEVFLIVIWTPRGVANVLYLLHLHGLFFPLVFGPLNFDVNRPKFGLLPVARCYPLFNHFFHPLSWILTSPNSSPETLQKQKAVRIQDSRTSSDCQEDCACRKGSCTNNTTDIHCTGDP